MVNKNEFISQVNRDFKREGITANLPETKIIVEKVLDILAHNIASGATVSLPEIGIFQSNLKSYKVPKKEKKIERWSVGYRACKNIKDRLNGKL